MPTVAVKLMRVANDWLDGDKFTRLMKTWRSHICISCQSPRIPWWRTFPCIWLQIKL